MVDSILDSMLKIRLEFGENMPLKWHRMRRIAKEWVIIRIAHFEAGLRTI